MSSTKLNRLFPTLTRSERNLLRLTLRPHHIQHSCRAALHTTNRTKTTTPPTTRTTHITSSHTSPLTQHHARRFFNDGIKYEDRAPPKELAESECKTERWRIELHWNGHKLGRPDAKPINEFVFMLTLLFFRCLCQIIRRLSTHVQFEFERPRCFLARLSN